MKKYDRPKVTVMTINAPCLLLTVSGVVNGPVGAPFMYYNFDDMFDDIENQ